MEPVSEHEVFDRRMTDLPAETAPDEICAVLTRELRSPLSTIQGYLELLAGGGVGPVTDEQREILDVLRRNVQRLTTTARDWHELARIEAGRLELAQAPVDLAEIADRAADGLRARFRSKAQQFTIDVAPAPCIVVGDQRALVRAVGHLLSNAHKYTPPGGAIRVTSGFEDDVTARLELADTGIGIRDEDQRHLFRKFFRAHLTEAEPGAGLGLTLARALIEGMGGRISVQSVLARGSTFSVLLPRAVSACGSPASSRSCRARPADSSPPAPRYTRGSRGSRR
jgi:signal transduction histidine kinase